jgi:hypothetical protein
MKIRSAENPVVIITRADKLNYLNDYTALPGNYGSPEYFSRPDIKSIRKAVYENLADLDSRIGFTKKISGKHVVIKPNLVTVFHNFGFVKKDYPNTTDPRVLDSVISERIHISNYDRGIFRKRCSYQGIFQDIRDRPDCKKIQHQAYAAGGTAS